MGLDTIVVIVLLAVAIGGLALLIRSGSKKAAEPSATPKK